jgi:hypothetical protein
MVCERGDGLCANLARDMGAAPGAVVGSGRGEAGIPSRGRHLRRCSRDPWDLFCYARVVTQHWPMQSGGQHAFLLVLQGVLG